MFSAGKLWNDSAAVANGDAAGPNSRLLDDGQLTNFLVTNMLEQSLPVLNLKERDIETGLDYPLLVTAARDKEVH